MATTLGAVAEGSIVYLNESGVATPFYVAKHNYESALNGDGRTLLVRSSYLQDKIAFNSANVNVYDNGTLDEWLNGTYLDRLSSSIVKYAAGTKIHSCKGNASSEVHVLIKTVFALSVAEMGCGGTNRPEEGTALPIASKLVSEVITSEKAWSRTPYTNSAINAAAFYTLLSPGAFAESSNTSAHVWPALTLPSTQGVDNSNNIIDGTGETPGETYTKLESITSSGTQYIDTGFKPNNNTRAIADVSISSSKTTQALFGGRTSASTTSGAMFAVFTLNTTTIRSDYNGAYTQSLNCPRDTRVTIDKNKETTSVNGNSASYANASFQSAGTLTIFALNENGTIESRTIAVMTLYGFKLYDNGTLVRDFIPARRNSDGAVGLLDQANNVFYGNAGTGTFTAGPIAEYTWLEWIESSGTQWIDTGFKPKYNTRVVMDVSDVANEYACLFGARTSGVADAYLAYRTTAKVLRGDYFGTSLTASIADATERTIVERNKNVLTGWGAKITNTAVSSGTCGYSLYLLAWNGGGSPIAGTYATAKIYSCQIYDGNTLVRDYIPAKRSDGAIGLYDKANNVFYTNNGTGSFSAGPEVSEFVSLSTSMVDGTTVVLTACNANVDGVEMQILYALANVDGIEVLIPFGESPQQNEFTITATSADVVCDSGDGTLVTPYTTPIEVEEGAVVMLGYASSAVYNNYVRLDGTNQNVVSKSYDGKTYYLASIEVQGDIEASYSASGYNRYLDITTS